MKRPLIERIQTLSASLRKDLSMRNRAMHYSGGVKYTLANGSLVSMLPGWPACVSGERAMKIQAEGRQTFIKDQVTCPQCRNRMTREKYDRFKPPFQVRAEKFVQDLKKLCKKYDVALGSTDGSLSLELTDGEKELDIEVPPPKVVCPTCGGTPGSALCRSICEQP